MLTKSIKKSFLRDPLTTKNKIYRDSLNLIITLPDFSLKTNLESCGLNVSFNIQL